MGEIKIGDFVYDRLGMGRLTVYEVGQRFFKAAPGGRGGWPEYTASVKTMIPVGKKARYGKLMTHAEWVVEMRAKKAIAWMEEELSQRRILATDIIRVALMLGWNEGGNGRA